MPKALLAAAWRVALGGLVFAAGLVASRLVFQLGDISLPRLPTQAPEAVAGWYLLGGSIVLAAGSMLSSRCIRGTLLVRWLALSALLFVGFGVSSTIEASIYSSTDGVLRMVPVLLLPCLLLAATQSILIKSPATQSLPTLCVADAFRSRTWAQTILRGFAAVAAFPLVYFIFGLIVSPAVSGYYESGEAGLTLPDPGIIFLTQFLRGGLHLLAVLPLMLFWGGSKRQLFLSLGLAFFVFVAAYDFVFAYQVPSLLVVIHGIEVLASSFTYAWILVTALAHDGQGG